MNYFLSAVHENSSYSTSSPTLDTFQSFIKNLVILVGIKWNLIMILICLPLKASKVEHLFMSLFELVYLIWRSACLFKYLLIFLWGYLSLYYWVVWVLYSIYAFLLGCNFLFSFQSFKTKILIVIKFNLSSVFLCCILEIFNDPWPRVRKIFSSFLLIYTFSFYI